MVVEEEVEVVVGKHEVQVVQEIQVVEMVQLVGDLVVVVEEGHLLLLVI